MPRFADLKRYLEHDGWVEYGSGADHYKFMKVQADGSVLRTKVSRGLAKEIPPTLWLRIRKQQLGLASDAEFWEKVH